MKYNKYVYDLINPFKSHKRFPYNILEFPHDLWFWVREKWFNLWHGFHPCETWNLETSIAIWILPRLKFFKKVNNSVPNEIVKKYGKGDVDKGFEKWQDMINDMIYAFKILSDEEISLDFDEFKKEKKAVDKGMKLFCKYYGSLWW